MKKIVFLFFFISTNCVAKNYYIDPSGDNTTGLTPAHAWTSILKLNDSWKLVVAGDSILFKKGEIFYGSVKLKVSGNIEKSIVISSYGVGANPVITGFSIAGGFKQLGNSIWESSSFDNTNKPNMVTIANVPIAMGRYPNYGYNYFTAFDNYTYIIDSALSGKNFTNGTLCIRKLHDIISNDVITSHIGSKLTYVNGAGSIYNTRAGYGYFIENHLAALDVQNEWFFDLNKKKIDIYSASLPTKVKVSTIDTLLYIGQYDYITVDGIAFEGANIAAIDFGGAVDGKSTNIIIKNCNINYSGRNAIYCTNNMNCKIDSCIISNSLNNAIYGENEGGKTSNIIIKNCIIKNSGTLPGMGYIFGATSDNLSYNGITILGDNALIQYNRIDTTGHVPIAFYYNNVVVRNNLIRYHNYVTDDGGGINVFDVSLGKIIETGREICQNIIIDGIGAAKGTPDNSNAVVGIYIDDKADGIRIDSNSIANTAGIGLYYHNVTYISARNNIIYNSSDCGYKVVHDKHAYGSSINNLIFAGNTIFQSTPEFGSDAKHYHFIELWNSIDGGNLDSTHIRLDSNTYARPAHLTDSTFRTYKYSGQHLNAYENFKTWKSTYSHPPFASAWDANSTQINIDTNFHPVRFEYNANNSVKNINLGANYELLNGTILNHLSLQPWSSAILTYYGR